MLMCCSKSAAPAAASAPDSVVRAEAFCSERACPLNYMLLLLLLAVVVLVSCLLNGVALALRCCTRACREPHLCAVGTMIGRLLM
jgi:hypothetical protein